MRYRGKAGACFIFLVLSIKLPSLYAAAILEGERAAPVQASQAMVVTSHFLATREALAVLKAGGNAIDAAVTAAFALAVTQPRSGNIGGGGFMLIASEKEQRVVAIDYREKAPAAASRDMFLDEQGMVVKKRSRFSHLSAGVPGTVAGLILALQKFGTISLKQALEPSIRLARDGFLVTPRFSKGLKARQKVLQQWPASRAVFYRADGSWYEAGDRFKQAQLAETLERIAKFGKAGFYAGKTADLIVKEMQAHDGLISHADLQNYEAVERNPVHGIYRGYDVYSMTSPSSGGVHIVQLLNILENYPLAELGHNSAQSIHLMAEAMKRAYADRSKYLGDADFVDVPLAGLTSKAYAGYLYKNIDNNLASPATVIHPGQPDGLRK